MGRHEGREEKRKEEDELREGGGKSIQRGRDKRITVAL